ncbi:MAG: NAD(P)/FAD-dependent oxidoreductase [Caldisericia bacterium]
MTIDFDVIIVGAGPAGLSLAGNLDKSLKVLLLDRHKEPHNKISCAEWVPALFKKAAITKTSAMVTHYGDVVADMKFPGKIIDRKSWQKSLLESLNSTTIHLGENVRNIDGNSVITEKGTYSGGIIVGADGPMSVVRKSHGLPISPVLPAVNVLMKATAEYDSTKIFFMDEIKQGYGWLFPKGEFANVGIGATDNLRDSLHFFISHLKKLDMVTGDMLEISAGLIPLYGLTPDVNDHTVLIGDAAGLTDPLTGAGIQQAFDSGMELARHINQGKDISKFPAFIMKMYSRYLSRRYENRKNLEDNWGDLKKAVESSWISVSK